MKNTTVNRDSDKFMLRFPEGMRNHIAEVAKANNRSMNAEIVARLMESLLEPPGANVNERRKLELVNSYVQWCRETGADPYKSFSAYAKAYADDENGDAIDKVSWISTVDPHYLSELYSTWILERPQRFPELADRLIPAAPVPARPSVTEPDPLFIAEIERRAAEWGCSKTQALIRMTIEEVEERKESRPPGTSHSR